jgi:signal transduction histidine kinase
MDQKGTRYFTGIVRDVTERKLAEEALRRTREERLRELERVRTRIAADLHDDIGSSLTKIVILSDVAQQKASENGGQKSESLNAISDISNELVEAMSDIVWAINPRKDRLSELSHRMRRFASDMFTARNIKFQFRAAHSDDDLQLGANVRREVFLIFKEASTTSSSILIAPKLRHSFLLKTAGSRFRSKITVRVSNSGLERSGKRGPDSRWKWFTQHASACDGAWW